MLSDVRSWSGLKYFCCIYHFLLGYIIFSFLIIGLNFSHVTTDIKWSSLRFLPIKRVCWNNSLGLTRLQFQNNSVHAEHGTILTTTWEELFTTDSTCNNVAHKWIALRQICCEIHLFPFISFFDPEAWKAKVGTYGVCTNKINLSI